jgi:glycerol uptake facilitator-like aquaporin
MDENYASDDDLPLFDDDEKQNRSSHLEGEGSGIVGSGNNTGEGGRNVARIHLNPAVASTNAAGSFRTFLYSACLSEFLSTFFLAFVGLSTLHAATLVGEDALSTGSILMNGLGHGFTYGALVYALSNNGGGYFPSIRQMNPALTLSLYLLGKLDSIKSFFIIASQTVGTILGTLLVWMCFDFHTLRVFELFDGTNIWQQLFMSIFVSFLFFFILRITNFAVQSPVRKN